MLFECDDTIFAHLGSTLTHEQTSPAVSQRTETFTSSVLLKNVTAVDSKSRVFKAAYVTQPSMLDSGFEEWWR
jgi:hypothetical protein